MSIRETTSVVRGSASGRAFLYLSIYLGEARSAPSGLVQKSIYLSIYLSIGETHYSYTPSDARAARALFGGDVHAGRAPRDCGVHEAL